MSEISATIARIRKVAGRKNGLADLAHEAGVPYTTVHSFAQRNWTHKNLEVIEKLAEAAARISARDEDEPRDAA